jgi:predicted transcriptional regulator YheO
MRSKKHLGGGRIAGPSLKQRAPSRSDDGKGPKKTLHVADPAAEAKLALLEDLVPKLARAIAPVCEVVLHQNTSQPPTIRAIGNGHITGRSAGDLMTLVVIDGQDMRDLSTPLYNYVSTMPDGRRIRVSAIPIMHEGAVIGYLGVNFLVHDFEMAQQALSLLIKTEPHSEVIEEKFLSPREVIASSIEEQLIAFGRPAAVLKKAERIELVHRLRERGLFGMRGAADQIASLLGVSRAAIYNYLNSSTASARTHRKG